MRQADSRNSRHYSNGVSGDSAFCWCFALRGYRTLTAPFVLVKKAATVISGHQVLKRGEEVPRRMVQIFQLGCRAETCTCIFDWASWKATPMAVLVGEQRVMRVLSFQGHGQPLS
ncbi:hypothetical protein ISCGN_007387 [Ixodes scapularis]